MPGRRFGVLSRVTTRQRCFGRSFSRLPREPRVLGRVRVLMGEKGLTAANPLASREL